MLKEKEKEKEKEGKEEGKFFPSKQTKSTKTQRQREKDRYHLIRSSLAEKVRLPVDRPI